MLKLILLTFALTRPVHADTFTCKLSSNDKAVIQLPSVLQTSFSSDGSYISVSNTEIAKRLNFTLPYDRLLGQRLIFSGREIEGVYRECRVLALSVEAFIMTVSGKDQEDAKTLSWSGDYGCTRVHR